MAKEFDIYLGNRVHQCDLIVYSLPFRNSISAEHRLILNCCLQEYMLQKFLAVETGSRLVSHIDKMIKICRERLDGGVVLNAEASLTKGIFAPAVQGGIALDQGRISLLANTFAKANSAISLTARDLNIVPTKNLGEIMVPVEPMAEIIEALKTSLERANSGISTDAQLDGVTAKLCNSAESRIELGVTLSDLLYRIYSTVESSLRVACSVLGTSLNKLSGSVESGVVSEAELAGEHVDKFDAFQNTVQILSNVTEKLIQFFRADQNGLCVSAEAAASVVRRRKLVEADGFRLSDMDGQTLRQLDYITLD